MPTAHWETPMPDWYFWVSDRFAVRLQYPSQWQTIPNQPDRMGGTDGFVQLSAENGDPVVMKVCQSEANHPTHPYGTAPVIESLTVNGQAACLILPSGDQSPDMQRQAMLIAQYPQPVGTILAGTTYTYFVVWADEQHIHPIATTIEFLPAGIPTPFPTLTPTPPPFPTPIRYDGTPAP
jgi:TolB protein